MLSIHSVNDINDWMMHVVALTPSTKVQGTYDGYMRITDEDEHDHELPLNGQVACYHKACYRVLGEPGFEAGKSTWASDQGHFFSTEHDVEAPESLDELENISLNPGWVAAWRKQSTPEMMLKAAADSRSPKT